MCKQSILQSVLFLHGILHVYSTGGDQLCLELDDEKSFCSSSSVASGKMLSKVMNSVLAIPIGNPAKFKVVAFNESISLPPEVPVTTKEFQGVTEKQFEFLTGPESLAKQGDFLYASAVDGIYKVSLKTGQKSKVFDGNSDCEQRCSRPLGIRIHGGSLFCADLLKGLIEIELETGQSKVLIRLGALVDGVKLNLPNDIDVDAEKQLIYLTDSSTKWGWDDYMFSLLEFDNDSRVIQYNLTSGEAKTFASGLHFANGVQISHDGKFLLVNEFSARRVVKFSLQGALPASGVPFTHYLPGHTDNIRPSATGGYWVALVSSRLNGISTLLEELQARPNMTRKIMNWITTGGSLIETFGNLSANKALLDLAKEMKNGNILGSILPTSAAIAELDVDGKVLRVLQSTKFGDFSEVLEDDTGLYIGTYLHDGIVKLSANVMDKLKQ